jgi:threonine synthase
LDPVSAPHRFALQRARDDEEKRIMRYVSTRGSGPVSFEAALLAGLAPDGGLYVPETWPALSLAELRALRGRPYTEIATAVMAPFVGDFIAKAELAAMISDAYRGFSHELVAPLVQIGPLDFLLELFHGPTLSFKDVALQLLARLYEYSLKRSGRRLTILCATSGDTGSAAIEAIRGRSSMHIVVVFPWGRVSDVQRRQMTTASEANVHVLGVDGSFDDCQRIVKELFADEAFAHGKSLTGVNSINWARIMAQAVYYVSASLALGGPARALSFVVPTGNFGNVYAGTVARRMGVAVKRLVVATNSNDILVRALRTGRYEKRGVIATSSPAMDIEVASNFERLVFEALGRDAAETRALIAGLAQSGAFTLPEAAHKEIAGALWGARADEAQVARAIADLYRATRQLIDPHTGVGAAVLGEARRAGVIAREDGAVLLATADPAKFADFVMDATGTPPVLPSRLADLMTRAERFGRVPADTGAIKNEIRARLRG